MMHKLFIYYFALHFCFSNACLCASLEQVAAIDNSSTYQDISSLLQPIVDKYDIPGMAAAIINDKEIIAAGAAGIRARNSKNKILVSDSFHIGSDTKSMTATMIAILVEKKKLKWDSRITEVFPELKGKIDPAYKDLTLEQLLTHRSGLAPNLNYDKIQKKISGNLVLGRQMVMEEALHGPPEGTPGHYLYSNLGYIIAGHMAEKATGESWENLISKYIFSPLKMNSAGFGSPQKYNPHDQSSLQSLNEPLGHNKKGKPVGTDNPAILGPAGTVHLSILDWAKYVMLHLKGARNIPSLLTLSSFQKLHEPVNNPPPAYAMGWIVEESEWANGKVLVHAGSNTYWFAKVWIAPSRNLAILVACNDGSHNAQTACNQAGLILMQSQLHLPKIQSIDPPKKNSKQP